jgi:hypothetical protein
MIFMLTGRETQDFYTQTRITNNSNKTNHLRSNATNKISNLRTYHKNIRGLRNKMDELLSGNHNYHTSFV